MGERWREGEWEGGGRGERGGGRGVGERWREGEWERGGGRVSGRGEGDGREVEGG